MEMAQGIIFDAGWIFFTVWGMVLAAVSMIAFGPDLLHLRRHGTSEKSLR